MTVDDLLADLLTIRARHQQTIDHLIDTYGRGVRPGWVSADLAIAWRRIGEIEAAVKEIENAVQLRRSGRVEEGRDEPSGG